MTLSLQWPLWMVWQLMNPALDAAGVLVAAQPARTCLYFAPLLVHMVASAGIATAELYDSAAYRSMGLPAPIRCAVLLLRVVPSAALASAMLPHQARRRPTRPHRTKQRTCPRAVSHSR